MCVYAHIDEDRLLAERAAEWLCRLQTAGPAEKALFVRWLRQSPAHVREMLIAMAWDDFLRHVDPQHKMNVEALAAQRSNVVRISK
jgi:ferric-dicitrate binding protein FerR (iron transport regulator)